MSNALSVLNRVVDKLFGQEKKQSLVLLIDETMNFENTNNIQTIIGQIPLEVGITKKHWINTSSFEFKIFGFTKNSNQWRCSLRVFFYHWIYYRLIVPKMFYEYFKCIG